MLSFEVNGKIQLKKKSVLFLFYSAKESSKKRKQTQRNKKQQQTPRQAANQTGLKNYWYKKIAFWKKKDVELIAFLDS